MMGNRYKDENGAGVYEEGTRRYNDSFQARFDVTQHFPSERPSILVNTGSRRRSDQAKKNEDVNHVNITWEHFPEDCKLFTLR